MDRRPGGKRAEQHVATAYLDEALVDFSGYIAADELYDGPYCVLSIVDNRKFRRLTYRVLDHNPTHEDMLCFFQDFKQELDQRGLALRGITTDGSPLYPVPIRQVFGEMPHQICEFHVIKELTQAILRAVAQARKRLKASMPALGRGRPSRKMNNTARRRKRLERKITDLFDHRHLFVKHHLTPGEKRTLNRITRGLTHLRTLREIMDRVYGLFDRRYRTDTALEKLARLRRRVRRFKSVGRTLSKLFSENLDKALTFLDDSLLPSTSNAVERGNRRHRKMQKTVYRVRTQSQISRRIVADMQREAQTMGRIQTTWTLHNDRNGCRPGIDATHSKWLGFLVDTGLRVMRVTMAKIVTYCHTRTYAYALVCSKVGQHNTSAPQHLGDLTACPSIDTSTRRIARDHTSPVIRRAPDILGRSPWTREMLTHQGTYK